MHKTIYVVKCNGNTQIRWFSNLIDAKAYCKHYTPDCYEIYEYELTGKIAEVKPKPLYKVF